MLGAEGISLRPAESAPRAGAAGSTVRAKGDAKFDEMAKEFEATFVSMLLKEMRQTLDQDGGGLFPGDSGDVQGGLFDMFLGRHLADAGGIGLAAALTRQMRATATPETHPDDPPPALPARGRLA